jgi:predicted enzyme related to lactoylglutathione lyase
MDGLVHFEIHATDPEKLIAFYTQVFGWKIEKYEGVPDLEYWGVWTCAKDAPNAINGGLIRRKTAAPADGAAVNAFVCTMQVADIDATMKKAEEAGGTLALPKFAIGGFAWQSYMKDPDGNIFGIHQVMPAAK